MSKEHLLAPENFFGIYKPGSDVNGVVAFTKKPGTDAFNKKFDTSHKLEEIRSWFTVAVLDTDYLAEGRLTRISKEEGFIPDLHLVKQMFFISHIFPMSHNIDISTGSM